MSKRRTARSATVPSFQPVLPLDTAFFSIDYTSLIAVLKQAPLSPQSPQPHSTIAEQVLQHSESSPILHCHAQDIESVRINLSTPSGQALLLQQLREKLGDEGFAILLVTLAAITRQV